MIGLITWLWQGALFAAATAVLLARAPRLNAATRHVIWWLTGAAVVAAPIVTSGIRSAAAAGPTVPSDVALLVPAPPGWVIPSALAAWTLFAAAALGRVAIALLTLVRLKRDGQPLDPAIASHLVEWRAASTGGPRTDVRVSDRIRGACALGLGRRVILVSRALVAKLSAADLDAIVMHEGAHLERRDDRWQLVQACAGAIVGWHPAMWYIGRRIRLEREAACDDHVVFRTHAPSRYSRALVRAAGIQASDTTRLASAIPGASVSASLLRIRVRRLLDPAIDRSPAPQLRPSALTVTALVAGLLVIGHVPAVVDFVDAERGLPIVSVTAGRFNELPTVRPVETTMSIGLARSAPARNAGRSDASAIAGPLAGRPLPLSASPLAGISERAPADAEPTRPLNAAPLAIRDSFTLPAPRAPDDGPWSAFARIGAATGAKVGAAGSATGDGGRAAGVSISRFFTRAGKGIASRF